MMIADVQGGLSYRLAKRLDLRGTVGYRGMWLGNAITDKGVQNVNGITANIGIAVRLGKLKTKVIEEPRVDPVYKTVIDTTWYDDVEYKEVMKEGDIDQRIFFDIRESAVGTPNPEIEAVAEFLKKVKDAELTITSYADRGTGNPRINIGYSKARAEKTYKALIDRGVDPKIIKSVEWKGDTVQPYEENDKNRVSIITGHGKYPEKIKTTVRKFKTSERQVRVN